jgi:hypothetical protein
VLDLTHDHLNEVTPRRSGGPLFGRGTYNNVIGARTGERQRGLIVDPVQLLCRSRLFCPKCNGVTIVFDLHLTLVLQMRPVRHGTLTFGQLDLAEPLLACAIDARGEVSEDIAAWEL